MFRHRAFREGMVVAAVCGFLFFFGLSWFGLVGADEPRYAQVAREMLSRHDWVTPVLGGVPWLEKPPLFYWQAMLAYAALGVNDFAARLPSAVDATLMVVAVFVFSRKFRPEFQLDGALIVASGAAVIGFARAASTDMPLAAMFGIGMLAWYAWHETSKKVWLTFFYIFIGLGVLAKGPVAVFLAAVVIGIYALMRRELHLVKRTLWLPGILLFCCVALPWYALVQLRNPEFLRVFILQHNLERFGSNLYHHREPFWFYIPVALLGLLPWTAFAVDAVIVNARRWWNERRALPADGLGLYLLIWLIVPIAFFSLSQSKLPGYILPALPAGSLLIVEYLARNKERKPFKKYVIVFHSLLSVGLIVPAALVSTIVLTHHFPWGRPAALLLAIVAGLAALCAFALTKYGMRALRFVTLVPVLIAVSAVLRLGAPALDNSFSARPVARQLIDMQGENLPVAVLRARREVEYGLQFYFNRNIFRYELGQEPDGEHLLVASQGLADEVALRNSGRKVHYLGNFPAQRLEFYWVSAK
jgi:4-amino-4-deoxy-L-arabinose transferase-like glycosyltransferase